MSRYRRAMTEIKANLSLGDRAALGSALEAAAALEIPPNARARLSEAAAGLREAGDRGAAARLLEPLLAEDYPVRALRLTTDRLPGVGTKTAAALARKEIRTVEDLLLFLPRAYEDRRVLVPIESLEVGQSACFEGNVIRAGVVPLRSGRSFFQATVSDATGAVNLKWFRGIRHFEERIRPGVRLLVSGDVRRYRYSKELSHPDVEVLADDALRESLPRIIPRYSTVEGLPPRTLRRIVESAVEYAADLVDSYVPESSAASLGLPEVADSVRQVHRPSSELDPGELRARRTPFHARLAAEELFLLQAGLALRHDEAARRSTRALAPDTAAVERALASLPFELTADQRRAWREIASDLAAPHPMSRLLLGDVGTGKTAVAFLAAAAAYGAGALAAVIAPTEILAQQHFETFRALAEPVGMRTALLTGSTPAAERRSLARRLDLGELAIVVGTHALLVESLELPRLGLAVIDEQHRFGVAQRLELERKGDAPHVLVMTATPIPRTLALTLYGDLDQSVLRERPPGRAPVETRVVPRSEGRRVLERVRKTVARGEQVYVVYPLVEESEKQDLLDATRGFERLQRALPDAQVALVHGRLDAAERSRVMARFAVGDVQVLVATTVIEVGIDVPSATLLVVQHAERFGLAQLHQLRGRVGRGSRPGRAILIGEPQTQEARQRLAVLEASASGFEIAEEDLRIRGAGEWLGTRQAGHLPELRLADLVRHGDLLGGLREAALEQVAADPGLARHPRRRDAIERRWGRRLEFGAVA
jgi:ATP-dependent DNA helicase RecG